MILTVVLVVGNFGGPNLGEKSIWFEKIKRRFFQKCGFLEVIMRVDSAFF
jgi:hypothetical protein